MSSSTKQLSILPSAQHGDTVLEAPKTHRPAVLRRTLDISGPFVNLLQRRLVQRTVHDAYDVPPTLAGSLGVLPPMAYLRQPATSFSTRFVHALVNKSKTTINAVAWLPGGRRVYSGAQTGEVTIWGGTTLTFESSMQAHECPVKTMTFTGDGIFMLSGDEQGSVRYWSPQLALLKDARDEHGEAVLGVSCAPSLLKFATASKDSTLKVWDFATAKPEQTFTGHGGDVNAVHWHPNYALVASGSKDGLVKMWDVKGGEAAATLHGHKAPVTAVSWNANGNWLLTASRDQTCKVWDLRTQRELGTFRGHNRDVLTASWHPQHEELFASGAMNGSLLYWLVSRPGPQDKVLGAHDGSVTALAWHPMGHVVCTGSNDQMLRFWARRRPGDGPDRHQAAMRQQEAGQGEAPKTKSAPTIAPSAGIIPGIGAAVPFIPAAAFDATQLERPSSPAGLPVTALPPPGTASTAGTSRLQFSGRPASPARPSAVPIGVKRPHASSSRGDGRGAVQPLGRQVLRPKLEPQPRVQPPIMRNQYATGDTAPQGHPGPDRQMRQKAGRGAGGGRDRGRGRWGRDGGRGRGRGRPP